MPINAIPDILPIYVIIFVSKKETSYCYNKRRVESGHGLGELFLRGDLRNSNSSIITHSNQGSGHDSIFSGRFLIFICNTSQRGVES